MRQHHCGLFVPRHVQHVHQRTHCRPNRLAHSVAFGCAQHCTDGATNRDTFIFTNYISYALPDDPSHRPAVGYAHCGTDCVSVVFPNPYPDIVTHFRAYGNANCVANVSANGVSHKNVRRGLLRCERNRSHCCRRICCRRASLQRRLGIGGPSAHGRADRRPASVRRVPVRFVPARVWISRNGVHCAAAMCLPVLPRGRVFCCAGTLRATPNLWSGGTPPARLGHSTRRLRAVPA